jgi:hypothetical protein
MTIEPLELRPICRPGMFARVRLHSREVDTIDWLRLGCPELTPLGVAGVWQFGAHLGRHATDAEEDAPWAVRFELVGVRLEMQSSGVTHVRAWISGDDPDDFRVPAPGYDPFAGAVKCTAQGCEPKGHPIVERYIPPANPELFHRVRGWRVSITWGASR